MCLNSNNGIEKRVSRPPMNNNIENMRDFVRLRCPRSVALEAHLGISRTQNKAES